MKSIVAVALVVLLAGCRTLPAPIAAPAPVADLAGMDWPARRAALQSRGRFELAGRVAVAAAGEGFNGKLHWVQAGTLCTLDLEGPLGVGGVRVSSDGDRLDLTRPSGEQLDSEAARAELEQRLGFEPPLAHLRYWVQGVPDPALPAQETADAGQRLSLVRGDVRVRLIIDRWQ